MYEAMAPWYDQLFPLSSQQLDFVSGLLKPESQPDILDIGCGTGALAAALTRQGARCTGIDLDEGMIREAKQSRRGPDFRVLNMMEISTAFADRRFDGILCMGNTLVHLPGPKEIGDFLNSASSLVKPRGILILQILNYDHILKKRPQELPALDAGSVRLRRSYRYRDDGVIFTTRLEKRGSSAVDSVDLLDSTDRKGVLSEQSVQLHPLGRGGLEGLLEAAGFSHTSFYGSFSGEPLADDSFPLISVSKR